MNWAKVLAAILGFAIGPAPLPAEPGEAEPPEAEQRFLGKTVGQAVSGRDFYVWDEDWREVADWARELQQSRGKTVESDLRLTVAATAARPSKPGGRR